MRPVPRAGSVLLLGLASCTSGGAGQAVNAAVAVVTTVAAAAIEHEINGECYATCGYGTHCDRKSGFCVSDREGIVVEGSRGVEPVTLDERCAFARAELVDARNAGLGDNHPQVQTLSRVLERCGELKQQDSDLVQRCGPLDLELVMLESDGFGSNHPAVIATRNARASCT